MFCNHGIICNSCHFLLPNAGICAIDQWVLKDLRSLDDPYTAAIRSFTDIPILICDLNCILGRHACNTGTCLCCCHKSSFNDPMINKWSGTVMDQHILCVFTRTKSFINRIVPFFSAGYYSRNLCKTIFFHDFFFAPENILLPCYQDHIPDQRTFLKTAQRITEHRHPVKLHKLLLYFAVHSLSLSAAFKKGLFHVQGLASQFAALCVDAQPGQQVLDLCAAPGGKSLTLAEAMQDKGQLVSGEFVPARVPLLQQAFDRCGITCAVAVENDATQHNSDWPTFDRVLCDVPCSGLGVIAKKPDIRYKDLDGIENLLAAQQKILQNGADSLAENGRLVYSTCTVNDKENQAQVEKFLSANPDFHVVLPKTALPGADITPLGTLFLPHRTGTDGFFAAILERN